jgi:hypothetical protein
MARALFAMITDNGKLLTDGLGTGEKYIKDRNFPWDLSIVFCSPHQQQSALTNLISTRSLL